MKRLMILGLVALLAGAALAQKNEKKQQESEQLDELKTKDSSIKRENAANEPVGQMYSKEDDQERQEEDEKKKGRVR